MNKALCLAILFVCSTFLDVWHVESRSIYIEVTHEDNFHVHDIKEQRDVIPLTKFEMTLWDAKPKFNVDESPTEESTTDQNGDQFKTSKKSVTEEEKGAENITTSDTANATLDSESKGNVTISNKRNINKQSNVSSLDLNDTLNTTHNETVGGHLTEHEAKQSNLTMTTGQHKTKTMENDLPGDKHQAETESDLTHEVHSIWTALQNRRQAAADRKGGGVQIRNTGGSTQGVSSARLGSLMRRQKRQTNIDMQEVANADWAYTTKSPYINRNDTGKGEDNFQVITEEDRRNAQKAQYKAILVYIGSTLLTVLTFTAIAFCFLKDPKTCIVAFGTGCPCCLVLLPCLTKFADKYLNPARIVKDNLNKYLPGVIIHDDGTIEPYDATPEEIQCVADIINEAMG